MQALVINFYDIKAARRQAGQAEQVVLRRADNALLLHPSHAGRRAAMARAETLTDLDKHPRTISAAHDQINLAAAAPRCPIIARQQTQALVLQILQGFVLGGIADFFAARLGTLRPKEILA